MAGGSIEFCAAGTVGLTAGETAGLETGAPCLGTGTAGLLAVTADLLAVGTADGVEGLNLIGGVGDSIGNGCRRDLEDRIK